MKTRKVVAPRRFDRTQCRAPQYERIVHRDYFAHCMRWSWAARLIKMDTRVLDVGCGIDAPLAKVLSGTNFVHGEGRYVGVDMNKGVKGHGKTWCEVISEFDFTARYAELGLFDIVTNFEVIEHMEVADGSALLSAMRECLKPDGRIFLSTPVLSPSVGQAANHLHEYGIAELQALIEQRGLEVVKRYGTFASYNPLKKALTSEHLKVYEELREFHGDDLMSCWLAPLYPDASRNNFWILKRE
jgi:2-polyprenyl-3-methyl-5-hydroxy-6-metoxy-1,4-benzoquinol methylase